MLSSPLFKRGLIRLHRVFFLGIPFLLATPGSAAGGSEPPSKSLDELVATAQSSRPKSLNSTLSIIRKRHKVPALAAAVVRDGEMIAIGAGGLRVAGSKHRVTIDDQFHLGSCTKSMTATLCALLVEDGKLRWDSTVGEVFVDLRDEIDPKFRDVTLEQLLCHRSGLPEDRRPDFVIFPKLFLLKGELPSQRLEFVKLVMGRVPANEPGTRYVYANFGFAVAGAMAEAATGESYENLMRRRLFAPLGMKTAGFGPPGDAKSISQPRGHKKMLAWSTAIEPGPTADNPKVIAPAGTVHCSVGDWAKYAAMHLAGARGEPYLLKRATFKKLHSDPYHQTYGFGWVIVDRDWAGRILAHDGTNGAWYASIVIAPDRDLAIMVATNAATEDAVEACRKTVERARKKFAD